MTVDKIIQRKDFITFVDSAKYFCTYLETNQNTNYKEFIADIQKQLIRLYTFGQSFSNFDLPDNREIKEIDITDNDIKDLLLLIRDRLYDPFYWVVFDPTDHSDTEPGCGDLVDDLGDIYKGIKTFLNGLENDDNEVKQNALWHLKWSFDNHWNDHCMNAIYAIHYYLKHDD